MNKYKRRLVANEVILTVLLLLVIGSPIHHQYSEDVSYQQREDIEENKVYLKHGRGTPELQFVSYTYLQDDSKLEELVYEVISCATVIEDKHDPYIDVSESDIELIAKILYLEGRGESIECQKAIVSVIVNRMKQDNLSASEVIFAPNQFSTACNVDSAELDDEMIKIVKEIVMNGPVVPEYVTYFRANKYHSWNSVSDYAQIDNTYFSYETKLLDEYAESIGENR